MASADLAKMALVWLSREEKRLLEQKQFLETMKLTSGLSAVSESVTNGIQSDIEEAMGYIGQVREYLGV